MSGMLSRMFGPPPAAAQGNNQPPTQGTGNPASTPANNQTIPNSTTPQSDGSVGAIPVAGQGNQSPLEGFAKLWDTPAAGVKPDPALTGLAPDLSFKPEDLMTAARGINFVDKIPQELLTKAGQGDSAALAQVINTAAQNGFAQSAGATARIVADVVKKQNDNFQNVILPKIFKDYEAGNAVRSAAPTLASNPAAAPMIAMLENQFRSTYPTATPDQIRQHAANYLDGFTNEYVKANGGTIVPKPNTEVADPFAPKSRGAETDWSKYFGE